MKDIISEIELKNIIDKMHDEIIVFDDNFKIVYANEASFKHYGVESKNLIGKNFDELDGVYWANSTLPIVYKTKKTESRRQVTNLGHIILTTSVPIFDDKGEILYVVQNVNDLSHINQIIKESEVRKTITSEEKISILYSSKEMQKVYMTIEKIKDIKSPCLILGETGTGKSYLANYIHNQSKRKEKPFVSLNCGCMNPNLIESELFGYKKGAFSGASSAGKKGIVEMADGGTLFLDEISEIPYDLQSKLLLFIQEQEFIPVGGVKKEKVDVKIITATNRSLQHMVENKTFREDLYFRINTFELNLPALKERKEDILNFLTYYLNLYNEVYDKKCIFSKGALEILENYSWPGNIRELANVVEKIVVLSKDNEIKISDLPSNLFKIDVVSVENNSFVEMAESKKLDDILYEVEKRKIISCYEKHKNSVKVAKELGISQPRAYRLIKKYIG